MKSEYLLNHLEINKSIPIIQSVSQPSNPQTNKPVQIQAEIGDNVAVDSVIIYYAPKRLSSFESVDMEAKSSAYIDEIMAQPTSTKVRYYVEARAVGSHGTTTTAEFAPLTYRFRQRLLQPPRS